MSDVFISYSRKDADLCKELIGYLKLYRIATWQDKRDIIPAEEWNPAIKKAIEKCKVFLVLLSGDALNSKIVKDEILKAFKIGRPILCIKLEDIEVEGTPIELLSDYHWIEVEDRNNILKIVPQITDSLRNFKVKLSTTAVDLGEENVKAQSSETNERSISKKWKMQLATVTVLIITTLSYYLWPTPVCCARTDQSLKELYIMWAISKELDPWVLSSFNSLLRLDQVKNPVKKMQAWLNEAKRFAADATEVAAQKFDYLDVIIDVPFDKLDMEKSFFRLWKRSYERNQSENLARVQDALVAFGGEIHQKVLFETWQQKI